MILYLGCNFLNRTIEEGHAMHIGFGEMPYCMTCRCLLGKLKCITINEVNKNGKIISNCRSEELCTLMSASIRQREYTVDIASRFFNLDYSLHEILQISLSFTGTRSYVVSMLLKLTMSLL